MMLMVILLAETMHLAGMQPFATQSILIRVALTRQNSERVFSSSATRNSARLTYKKKSRFNATYTCPDTYWDAGCEFKTGIFIIAHVVLVGFLFDPVVAFIYPKHSFSKVEEIPSGTNEVVVSDFNETSARMPLKDGEAKITLWNGLDVDHAVQLVAPVRDGKVEWPIVDGLRAILSEKDVRLMGKVTIGETSQEFSFNPSRLRARFNTERQMAEMAKSCANRWIDFYNNLSSTPETFPAQIELLYECMQSADYIRISEKFLQYTLLPGVGSMAPFALEIEWILFRTLEFYRDQLERHPNDPVLRDRASVSWRRLASFPDRHLFSELSIFRTREILEGSPNIGEPMHSLVPLGLGRWEFIGGYDLGNVGIEYEEMVSKYRRRPDISFLQSIPCVMTLLAICPARFDNSVYLNTLRHLHLGFRALDRNGKVVQLPNLERLLKSKPVEQIRFH